MKKACILTVAAVASALCAQSATAAIQIVKFVNGEDAKSSDRPGRGKPRHGDLHLRRHKRRGRAAGQRVATDDKLGPIARPIAATPTATASST